VATLVVNVSSMTTAHPGPAERSCRGTGTENDNARYILHFIEDQHLRDTGSMLSTTQSGGSRRESSPMLPLGRGKRHCAASLLSSGGAQPTWIRKPSTTTSLAETHRTVSRGGSASTQCPCYLSPQLSRESEPRSRLHSHKALSPHQTSLQQMLQRPPGEGRAQVMVGDHGHTLPDSPEQRQKLARIT